MKLDKQMQFKAFNLDGVIFDLSHLNAHTVEYRQKPINDTQSEIQYLFYITYSMHCFTKDYPNQCEAEKEKLMYYTSRESRPFCRVRYELSKKLPEIIRGLATARIGFAGYDNFATIEIFNNQTQKNIFYKITFTAYRFEKKMRLHITSAYPIEEWERLKPVGFFKIANNLLKGKSLPKA